MQGPFIVSLDLGTSGCRAAAVTPDGKIFSQTREPLLPLRDTDGTSYYRAEDLWTVQRRVLDALLAQLSPSQVAGIAVSSQRSTVVLWNERTGEAVAPVLTWEDGRAVHQVQQAAISQEAVHGITGLYKTPYFSAPKIAWCLQNLQDAKETLEAGNLCVGSVATYFIWKLTHGAVFATDISLAQRMLLLDMNTAAWSAELCHAFAVPAFCLPTIQPSSSLYGTYTYQGVDIPILSCVADQQAAAYWMNLHPAQSCINYGTGAFLLYNTDRQAALLPGMLTSLAPDDGTGIRYFLEGPVNAAGSIFLWLNAQGFSYTTEELDALCNASKHPVELLPALGGLGAPYFDVTAKPAVANLSASTRKADWVAGAARGLAFLLTDIAVYLKQHGYEQKYPVLVSGGLSRLDYLLRFQTDLLQCPVRVVREADATLLGAAKMAALQAGWDLSTWAVEISSELQPQRPVQEIQLLYQSWQKFVTMARKQA